ncbi:hypothetical protein [Streptomyces sp. NPDC059783]|uniref:hypothetical protein n=1 Tax=Streptomyces sp. NPDC059783 TaxID=3346944 RepID=UPI0036695030
MAQSRKAPTTTWQRLAQPSDRLLSQWRHRPELTYWEACGRRWDAVAITPISLGLAALSALRISPRRGYPVLADHLRGCLYVLVPPGTGITAAGLPGVRVLGTGHQLLVPAPGAGSPAAHWISAPGDGALLVRPDRLTHHLRALLSAGQPKAASS